MYSRRKVFWDTVTQHINAGYTWQTTIDKIYEVYGQNLPVTKILVAMTQDKARGGHPNLKL
ncbi:MAG: hypothetical protein MUF12_09845 [Sediminibacterium sp.]|nr:hypothetical protein [Sediminibacterium sp.]